MNDNKNQNGGILKSTKTKIFALTVSAFGVGFGANEAIDHFHGPEDTSAVNNQKVEREAEESELTYEMNKSLEDSEPGVETTRQFETYTQDSNFSGEDNLAVKEVQKQMQSDPYGTVSVRGLQIAYDMEDGRRGEDFVPLEMPGEENYSDDTTYLGSSGPEADLDDESLKEAYDIINESGDVSDLSGETKDKLYDTLTG